MVLTRTEKCSVSGNRLLGLKRQLAEYCLQNDLRVVKTRKRCPYVFVKMFKLVF